MKFVLTPEEYEEKKKDILKKLDSFIQDYNDFTRKTNSQYWRATGHHFAELKKIKEDIPRFEPLKMKELDIDWVRDDLLTDEEKEEWKTLKKFNL